MLVLIATIWIIDSLNGGLFHMNILRIPQYVQNYDLDFFLIKPVSSRLYVSVKYISYGLLSGIPFGILLLCYSLIKMQFQMNLLQIFCYIISIFAGTFIMHNIFFLLTVLSVKFVRMDALQNLCWNVLEIGKYPASIYPDCFRKIFVFIIPVITVYNFPVYIILHFQMNLFIILLVICAFLFFLTNILWNFILKYYY